MSVVIRHDWNLPELHALFDLPFNELLFRAACVHRQVFDPSAIQIATLLSIKTGGCPEDCAYCPQSQRYQTGVTAQKMLEPEVVAEKAREAKQAGASRFCMGAAWRELKDRDLAKIIAMIREVKALGLESCATLGMLTAEQAAELKKAGLDFYNHNLDTSPDYYSSIIQTRQYQERLQTLEHVRNAGLKTCCGGIVGLGETREQRVGLLLALANLPAHPESVPINQFVQVAGTPLHGTKALDPFEFVRMIAVARCVMPRTFVRLSAGRSAMSDEMQALCFLAGANSIFYGDTLLTTQNNAMSADQRLLQRLGLRAISATTHEGTVNRAEVEQGV